MSFTSSRLATHTIPQCFGTAGPLTPRLQTQMHGVRTKWTQFSSARLVGASVGRGAEAVRRLCGDLSHWVVRDPPALVVLRSAPSSLAASPPPELAAFRENRCLSPSTILGPSAWWPSRRCPRPTQDGHLQRDIYLHWPPCACPSERPSLASRSTDLLSPRAAWQSSCCSRRQCSICCRALPSPASASTWGRRSRASRSSRTARSS